MDVVQELALEDVVTSVGARPRDELKYYYSAADVFVTVPWYEPFGMTPLEAMACGTPVIGSNVGGIPEVMGDLGREWLPEATDVGGWADALTRMIELPEPTRLSLGQRAKTVAARFTPRNNVETVQRLYDELLSGSS